MKPGTGNAAPPLSGIFVTATDTGVGKTAVACALALVLRRRGADVGVMKPVASGCRDAAGRLVLEDADRLRAAAGSDDELSCVCPVALAEPLSPHLAAERAAIEIDLDHIFAAFREIAGRHELMIVEGVGGLLAPITSDYTVADMAAQMGLPLVVVTRWGLGTINHTLLTVHEARRRRLAIAGLVLNECADRAHGIAEQTAPRELRRLTGETILAQIPYLSPEGPQETRHPAKLIEQIAARISDLAVDRILKAAGTPPASPPGTLSGETTA